MILSCFAAADGDCYVLSYDVPRKHIVVDVGRSSTYPALKAFLAEAARRSETFELLIVTHTDADHIEGALELVRDAELPLAPRNVWFNGRDQVSPMQEMSLAQADEFSAELKRRGWRHNVPWGGEAVMTRLDGAAFEVLLPGDLRVSVLSPDFASLRRLGREWNCLTARRQARPPAPDGLQPMGRRGDDPPTSIDVERLRAEPELGRVNAVNFASVAFLAEHSDRRCLFMADAGPSVLRHGLTSLNSGAPVRCELATAVHHGSRKNLTVELLEMLECDRYVFSTNGSQSLPDPAAIARILTPNGRHRSFYFNYRQPWTVVWDVPTLKAAHLFETAFRPDEVASMQLSV